MRFFFILIFIYLNSFSQTNQSIVNQAVERAKSQNITTKNQVVQALESRGITENQARQIAKQRGLSYDQLVDEYFDAENNTSNLDESDPNTSILEELPTDSEQDIITDDFDNDNFRNKGSIKNYFGYNIFENNPYLNKEYLLGNIDEGYLISPGDEIRIITYGDNSLEVKVKVDKNGNINIKNYGLFFAAGMTFKTLKSRLKIFLGKYLSGLVSIPQKTFMDVALTQLKPTKVVVLGQVKSPGPHILTTSGSALSALYAAGGVKYSGSLREIIIYRNNKLFKKIDLYNYIVSGEIKNDVTLTNNDIVFVPNRKNLIELKGEVRNSAIYETLENEDLSTLLEYSGGLLPTTQTNKVNIQRIIPAKDRVIGNIVDRKLITINYQKLSKDNKKINLSDGDQITFFRILDLQSNQVTISGHVFEPGTYSLEAFNNLKTLIFDAANGVLPDVYLEKVDVYSIKDGIEVLKTYNLSDVILDKINISLLDGDRAVVYNNEDVEGKKSIFISGFGVSNTEIEWKENFSLYDLIFNHSQIKNPEFTSKILETRIDLKRYNTESGNYNTKIFNFNDIDVLKQTKLFPRDRVVVYGEDIIENTEKKVGIYGYVKDPNSFKLEENMFVEDLILLSGGFEIQANKKDIIINRLDIDNKEERIIRKIEYTIDENYLLGLSDSPLNKLILQDNDIVLVKKVLGYENPIRVNITGEVNFEGNVILEFKNTSFEDIINFSGGLTKYANIKSSTLIRNGQIIAVDFSKIQKNERLFFDGDEINIGSNKGTVKTQGAIENQSTFVWKKGDRAKKYIRNSGGKKKSASKSYVINNNGKTQKISLFRNPKILPNSSIIVNEKIKKERVEGQFMSDFTQTFSIIASTITTILLASKL